MSWGTAAYGGYRTLMDNGPSSNRVDVVFMGDGYTAGDIADGTYASHNSEVLGLMFAGDEEPFRRYEKFFNVHEIELVSNESGADIPPEGIFRDTALDASYYWNGVKESYLWINETKAAAALNTELAGAGFSAEMKMVPINYSRYGGSSRVGIYGGSYAVYAAGDAQGAALSLHELGHGFADLADEYAGAEQTYSGPEPEQVNVTSNPDPATVKWSDWIGYEDPGHPEMGAIGIYEGARYLNYGLYRPSEDSKMRSIDRPFDAVSREQLILRIYNYVDPLDDWLDNAGVLVDPAELWVAVVDPAVIAVEWQVDGVPVAGAVGQTFSVVEQGLSPGEYEVTARAYDRAMGDWVRRDLENLQMSVDWTVQVVPEAGLTGALAIGGLLLFGRRGNRDKQV